MKREQFCEFYCDECCRLILIESEEAALITKAISCPTCDHKMKENCIVEVDNLRRITEPRFT